MNRTVKILMLCFLATALSVALCSSSFAACSAGKTLQTKWAKGEGDTAEAAKTDAENDLPSDPKPESYKTINTNKYKENGKFKHDISYEYCDQPLGMSSKNLGAEDGRSDDSRSPYAAAL